MSRFCQLLLLIFTITLTALADPYSELGKVPIDTVLAVGFELKPDEVAPGMPAEPEDLDRIQLEDVLWKHLRSQSQLKGCAAIGQQGFVIDVAVDDPRSLQAKTDEFVADAPSWNVNGSSYQDYSQRFDFTDDGHLLFGDLEAVKAYIDTTKRLSEKKQYQDFPHSKKAQNFVYYLVTDAALKPEPELYDVQDSEFQEALKAVFHDLPSYPDLAIVSNDGDSQLVVWGGSTKGLAATNKSILDFNREMFVTMSLRSRLYLSIMPPLKVVLANLGNGDSSPAEPIWTHFQQIFGLDD
jgi:hypothetical protein